MGACGLDLLEKVVLLPQRWETPAPFFLAGRQGVCKPWGTAALSNLGLSSSKLGIRILR